MTKNTLTQFCSIAAIVALPALSWAGTPVKETKASTPTAKLDSSILSGDIGMNVVTAYYYHGVIQQKREPSFQPYADLNIKVYAGDGFLNKAVINLGVWESFTTPSSSPANAAGDKAWSRPKSWVESDFVPGISLTFGKITISEAYQIMLFPNQSTPYHSESLVSKIGYDDADLLGAFALHPTFTLQHETKNKAAIGDPSLNSFGHHGNYWEGAVAPSFSAGPVTFTLPLAIAFGTSNYYLKNGYGYFSGGLNVGYELPVPKSLGTWTATAGATYYNLKKTAVTGDANNDVVGTIGLGVAF
jgi:hypothetical protein